MKTFKTHIIIDNNVPSLTVTQTSDSGFSSDYRYLPDLTAKDIDDLIVLLQKEKAQLEKLTAALK